MHKINYTKNFKRKNKFKFYNLNTIQAEVYFKTGLHLTKTQIIKIAKENKMEKYGKYNTDVIKILINQINQDKLK